MRTSGAASSVISTASPAKLVVAVSTGHVVAASVLLDDVLAPGALLHSLRSEDVLGLLPVGEGAVGARARHERSVCFAAFSTKRVFAGGASDDPLGSLASYRARAVGAPCYQRVRLCGDAVGEVKVLFEQVHSFFDHEKLEDIVLREQAVAAVARAPKGAVSIHLSHFDG